MNEDGIELTGCLRERDRADGRPLTVAIIESCGRRQTAASILLRGIEGPGSEGQPRAGLPLPRWDGPLLTVVAVDTRPAIEALLGEVLPLPGHGLLTLTRTRLLSGEIDPVWLGERAGEATRLTLYCGQQDRVYQVPAFEAACELLYRRGIAGATVLSGADGTFRGRRRRAAFLRRETDVPLMLTAVGDGDRIGMLLPELGGLFRHPLMTLTTVRLCKRDGQFVGRPWPSTATAGDSHPAGMGTLFRLTVYTSEAARHDGQPVHRAIARRLRSAGLGEAASVRGIWGFRADHAPHGGHFPHLLPRPGHHVPVVTTVIGTPERISAAFDVIDPLTAERGLVTAEAVRTPRASPVHHES